MVISKKWLVWGCAVLCAFIFVWIGTTLPRTTDRLFASPDETAVFIFAKAWAWGGGFKLPYASEMAGLHPRSMVQQGEWLVPVSFLGMPFIAAMVERIHTGWSAYLTVLLALSSAFPLWALARRAGNRVAWVAVAVYLSFPTVLLYVNRGLFPNLPVVALSLWILWLFSKPGAWRYFLGGMLAGLAGMIRPTEMIWLFPWMIWSVWISSDGKGDWRIRTLVQRIWPACLAMLVVACFGVMLSMKTYPFHAGLSDQPVIGYLLRDIPANPDPVSSIQQIKTEGERSLSEYLPFGFHPRVMLRNIRIYLGSYLGLWSGLALFGVYIIFKQKRDKRTLAVFGLSLWTVGVLLLLYGQADYTDNINGTVSLGNSFLRYLLPIVPLLAIGCAHAVQELFRLKRRGAFLALCLTGYLVLYGCSVAWAKDNEGLASTRTTLRRYEEIRAMAESEVPAGSVILSERSDKIFASGDMIVASPLPSPDRLRALAESGMPVYFFHRLSSWEEDAPRDIVSVFPMSQWSLLFSNDNEGMYRLNP